MEKTFNVKDVFYNYRMRKSSVMNDSDNSRLISDRVDCFVERYEFISKNEPVLKKAYYNHFNLRRGTARFGSTNHFIVILRARQFSLSFFIYCVCRILS